MLNPELKSLKLKFSYTANDKFTFRKEGYPAVRTKIPIPIAPISPRHHAERDERAVDAIIGKRQDLRNFVAVQCFRNSVIAEFNAPFTVSKIRKLNIVDKAGLLSNIDMSKARWIRNRSLRRRCKYAALTVYAEYQGDRLIAKMFGDLDLIKKHISIPTSPRRHVTISECELLALMEAISDEELDEYEPRKRT